jgi:hypothetical protein
MELETNSNYQTAPEEKSKWGGARPGAGRPKGLLTRISAGEILEEIEKVVGLPFATQLALCYQQALYGDDDRLKLEYNRLILSKVVADKIDLTSNGETLQAPTLQFASQEIVDYIDVKHT